MPKTVTKGLMYSIYGPGCFYCNEEEALTVDHVVPRCAGGGNSPGNKVPACFECNFLKDQMPLEYFVEIYADRIREDFDPLYKFRENLDKYGVPRRYFTDAWPHEERIYFHKQHFIQKKEDIACLK